MSPVKAKLLEGKKGLIIGIANDQSIAWGCAKAFRALGAELAITYLNDKAKKYVEPLARQAAGTYAGVNDAEICPPGCRSPPARIRGDWGPDRGCVGGEKTQRISNTTSPSAPELMRRPLSRQKDCLS
jgi:hypothetical protein